MERICENCGKAFLIARSRIKNKRGKFCSKKCLGASFNSVDYHCENCGKIFKRKQNEIKKKRHIYCSKNCMANAYSEKEKYKGENNHNWRGGWYPYYGGNWLYMRKKALKRAGYKSEISGKQGDLVVHHIMPMRIFVETFAKLCLEPYLIANEEITFPINYLLFQVLPYDLVPDIIFKEANNLKNLLVLTKKEHDNGNF